MSGMTDTFVIATGNSNKVREFKRILEPLGFDCVSAKEIGIDMNNAVENGTTFQENSVIKAKYAFNISGKPVIADDSGLCVDVLNGRPGIYSARYAGPGASDRDKCIKLLSELEETEEDARTAAFHCSITCILSGDQMFSVEGICRGKIAHEMSGCEGFGYDPIFIPRGKEPFSMASLSGDEKDTVSHRGHALRMFKDEIVNRLT